MSVACATSRARTTRPSGRRRSSCAKATSSTSRSTTASTGRATPTRRSPVRACRSMRRARIPGCAAGGHGAAPAGRAATADAPRRRRQSRSRHTTRRPATTSDPTATATRRPISRTRQQDLAVDAGPARRVVVWHRVAPWQSAIRAKSSSKRRPRRSSTSSPMWSRHRTGRRSIRAPRSWTPWRAADPAA